MSASAPPVTGFGWGRIARIGAVQAALGAVVVLTTSTLNRVMVVELALPALVPGALVALHFVVQLLRPRMGHGSDVGGRRTPWIVGGMAGLALGGFGAAVATAWMATAPLAGLCLAVASFALLGVGISACGTSLLVLLAKRVDARRRAPAATLVWLMMIVGFAVTSAVAGRWLEPYSAMRLIGVSAVVSVLALLIAVVAMRGLEGAPSTGDAAGVPAARAAASSSAEAAAPRLGETAAARFADALREAWAEPVARRFTVFVFVSMLAYSAQDLILEPFAGAVFGFTPGASTQLSGVQHAGALLGMLAAASAGRGGRFGSLRGWQVGGCIASALALLGLSAAGAVGIGWPLTANVFLLGAANGAFSIAAVASMMQLAGAGGGGREGVRMGLWGAAQAIAFAVGGLVGTGASDLARWWIGSPGPAYAAVFAAEALLFGAAALLVAGVGMPRPWRGSGVPPGLSLKTR